MTNVILPAVGTGTTTPTIATETIAAVEYQKIKLVDATATSTTLSKIATPADGATLAPGLWVNAQLMTYNGTTADLARGTTANGLAVDVTRVQGTVTVDSELPAAAALADTVANPTVPTVGSDGSVWSGLSSQWNRQRSIWNAMEVSGDGVASAGLVAQFDNVAPGTIGENNFGPLRMSNQRELFGIVRDAAGNNRGANVNSSNQLSVTADAVIPGTGATNLGKAEDAAHTSGDTGVFALGVRNDGAQTSFSDTNLDYTPIAVDDRGAVHLAGDGLPIHFPSIIQKTNTKSTGSVASINVAFGSNVVKGNSIIVACAVGNSTTPTISDTIGNTYKTITSRANSSAFKVALFFAPNTTSGANTVTVTNGGANASMAMEIYEVNGLLAQSAAQPQASFTDFGTSSSITTTDVTATTPNSLTFMVVGLGTAAQTITPDSGWTNDSGQQNPTTPAGLFSFISASQFSVNLTNTPAGASFTSEPYAMCAAIFHPVALGVHGTMRVTDGAGSFVSISGGRLLVDNSGVTQPVGITQIAGTSIVTGGTAGTQSVGGIVANNGTINSAVNPVLIGGQAVSSENAANTTAKLSQFVTDLVGKQIVLPYANPELFISSSLAAITDNTTHSLFAAQSAGVRTYITQLTVTNSHATVGTLVSIKDGASGTILHQGYAAAAGGGFTATFPVPLKGTAATLVEAICGTTGSNIYVCGSGYKGV